MSTPEFQPTPTALPSLANKRVLVMGLGNFDGGAGVSRWLAGQGAKVTVTDMAPAEKLARGIAQLGNAPVTLKLGGHDEADFLNCDILVVNPAVERAKSPFVQAAIRAGAQITSEINLFLQRCPAFTIGVTGSVGKSTTASLIYRAVQAGVATFPPAQSANALLSPAPRPPLNPQVSNSTPQAPSLTPQVFLGGNIGKSLLEELPNMHSTDIAVLELSSFMLEDTPAVRWSPNIAVITNLVPNHLDRHHTMAAYAAAKQNILAFQKPADIAVLNADDDLIIRWAHKARGKVVKYTIRGPSKLALLVPGDHNQSNARAAVAVLDALLETSPTPVDRSGGLRAIAEFPGLAHRLELVHTSGGNTGPGAAKHSQAPIGKIHWYNDSKATTPQASITAIQAFPAQSAIFLIGGYDKHLDMTDFVALLADRAAGVIGLGQTGRALVEQVQAAAKGPLLTRIQYAETLENAVPLARKWAQELLAAAPGGRAENVAVVLSPASASWGQFSNYEQRGEAFTKLAWELA